MTAGRATAGTGGTFWGGLRRGAATSPAVPVWVVLLVLLALSALLVGLQGGAFLTLENLRGILERSVALGVVAAGQTLAILAGSLDLSVAELISAAAILASVLMQGDPGKVFIAIGAVLAVGAFVGLVNGLVITKLQVNAFIATLGMALVIRGITNAGFNNFAGSVTPEFRALGYESLGPVPYSVILLFSVIFIVWFVLRFTRLGHHVYAVGGGEETSRLSGVQTHRVIVLAHVLTAMCAATTGLFLASRLGQGAPWIGRDGLYDLESVAAVVLGGTALAGGRGGVLGTLAGVLILGVLDSLFNALQVDPFLKTVIRGVIIVAAVAAYATRGRRRRSA